MSPASPKRSSTGDWIGLPDALMRPHYLLAGCVLAAFRPSSSMRKTAVASSSIFPGLSNKSVTKIKLIAGHDLPGLDQGGPGARVR